jgi:release factor glutamine methyltransferase
MPTETESAAWTILTVLRWTTSYFDSRGIDSPRTTAELLLARSLGLGKIDLYLRFDQPLQPAELSAFKELIRRRTTGEPTAYILGAKSFWNQELKVTPEVLIPRPETEHLVEAAVDFLRTDRGAGRRAVLDLGTGSGAIVLALAAEAAGHRFFASDRSPGALAVARDNAGRNPVDTSVHFFCSRWFQALKNSRPAFDLIVSNPPYIPSGQIEKLQPEISRHEPRSALDGGPDGLAAIGEIIAQAPSYLKPGGWLMLEIGAGQHAAVRDILRQAGRYANPVFLKDYSGHRRVLKAAKAKL